LPECSNVKLKIYDALGRDIKILVDSFQNTGEHSIVWDAMAENNHPVSPGIYFYQLKINSQIIQKKMSLVR
jgi:hypothetical protein